MFISFNFTQQHSPDPITGFEGRGLAERGAKGTSDGMRREKGEGYIERRDGRGPFFLAGTVRLKTHKFGTVSCASCLLVVAVECATTRLHKYKE